MLQNRFPKQWQSYIDLDKLDPIDEFLEAETKAGRNWQPNPPEIFRALELTTPDALSVQIMGMDPYPTKNVPNGLAFSVHPDNTIPKSLINIYKEYKTDLGYPDPLNGDLTPWANQDIILLMSGKGVSAYKSVRFEN